MGPWHREKFSPENNFVCVRVSVEGPTMASKLRKFKESRFPPLHESHLMSSWTIFNMILPSGSSKLGELNPSKSFIWRPHTFENTHFEMEIGGPW